MEIVLRSTSARLSVPSPGASTIRIGGSLSAGEKANLGGCIGEPYLDITFHWVWYFLALLVAIALSAALSALRGDARDPNDVDDDD